MEALTSAGIIMVANYDMCFEYVNVLTLYTQIRSRKTITIPFSQNGQSYHMLSCPFTTAMCDSELGRLTIIKL